MASQVLLYIKILWVMEREAHSSEKSKARKKNNSVDQSSGVILPAHFWGGEEFAERKGADDPFRIQNKYAIS